MTHRLKWQRQLRPPRVARRVVVQEPDVVPVREACRQPRERLRRQHKQHHAERPDVVRLVSHQRRALSGHDMISSLQSD